MGWVWHQLLEIRHSWVSHEPSNFPLLCPREKAQKGGCDRNRKARPTMPHTLPLFFLCLADKHKTGWFSFYRQTHWNHWRQPKSPFINILASFPVYSRDDDDNCPFSVHLYGFLVHAFTHEWLCCLEDIYDYITQSGGVFQWVGSWENGKHISRCFWVFLLLPWYLYPSWAQWWPSKEGHVWILVGTCELGKLGKDVGACCLCYKRGFCDKRTWARCQLQRFWFPQLGGWDYQGRDVNMVRVWSGSSSQLADSSYLLMVPS